MRTSFRATKSAGKNVIIWYNRDRIISPYLPTMMMEGGGCMLDRNHLRALQNADISACETDRLTDIKVITYHKNQRTADKMNTFIACAGNPYLFKVGETVVKVEFEGGKSFAESFTNLIRAG